MHYGLLKKWPKIYGIMKSILLFHPERLLIEIIVKSIKIINDNSEYNHHLTLLNMKLSER